MNSLNRLFVTFAAGPALMLGLLAAADQAVAEPTEAQTSAIRSNCRSDYMSYCSSVPRGGAASLECLKQNVAKLSSACQQAVNAIAPGYIATKFIDALMKDPNRSKAILGRTPAGRWGDPDDIGAAAIYLASPASDYVHGSVLTVDGGWMAW